MADRNETDAEEKFFREILSPSELFAARSRSHKIPVRGQKDFFPDDSDEQRRRLEQSLSEHWSLVSEERVERLGNLVKAKWIPSEQMVELQSPAGKFWQTMGFSADGKQRLWPEEALYLMECGNLLVFHRDLPLSIQDGYERFLSSATVSLQQYQVFGHLKRLGYVVHRFDPSWEPTPYVQRVNLPQPRDRAGRQLKRKRSPSPAATPSITQDGAAPAAEGMDKDQGSRAAEDEDEERPESQAGTSAGHGGGRTWWIADTQVRRSDPRPASCWHFTPVPFPDLGSGDGVCSTLPPPDPSLLPGAVAVGVCDVAAWRRRLNQREDRTEERNVDGEKEVRRCSSWAEYREPVAQQQGVELPAHLWGRDIAPLHDPRRPIPTGELLDKLSVIRSTHLLEGASSIQASDQWKISFNVYQPDSVCDFKKSHPGKPDTRVCVSSFDGPVPDLRAIKLLTFQSRDVPVVFAVVDHGDISFYTFKDFQLPRDVFP